MIKVRLLSPEWNRSFEAEAVFLPGDLGEFEVLRNHAPIVSTLTAGKIRWRVEGGSEESLNIKWGVARLKDNCLNICVEV